MTLSLVLESFLFQLCGVHQLKFSYIKQRSVCDTCRHQLKWFDLIPIVSFLWLKGRCRYCKQALSPMYVIGELLALVPLILLYYQLVYMPESLFLALYLLLLGAALYDIQTFSISLHYLIITLIVVFVLAPRLYWMHLFIVVLLHVFFFMSRCAMGYGDILIFSMISLVVPYSFFMILFCLTFMIGGLVILIYMALCRHRIPKIPLIPLILISFVFTSLFYAHFLYITNFN